MKKNLLLCAIAFVLNASFSNLFAQGACCVPVKGCQQVANEAACTALEGHWVGGACNTTACPSAWGGCCIMDRNGNVGCENMFKTQCVSSAGGGARIWHGEPCSKLNCESDFGSIPPNPNIEFNPSFTVSYDETSNKVLIRWTNPLQNENPNFIIARSSNGSQFKMIGLLNAFTTAATTEFTDHYPLPEGHYRVYYNTNNRDYASQTIAVFAVAKNKMQVFPNPTSGKLRILLAGMQTFDTEVSIFDMTGRLMLSKKINKGSHPEIDLSSLSKGTYMVQAKQNGTTYSEKIQKN